MTAAATTPPLEVRRTERSTNLDALRAVAALYVLAGHAYLLSGSFIGFHDRHPVRLAINTGGAGVWLFFALSGYLIAAPFVRGLMDAAPLPRLRTYARRRILRIYPAYWVAFAAVVVFGLPATASVSVRQVAVHGALLHNLVPGAQQAIFFASWTLTLEVLFYIAVPAGAVLARRHRRVWSAQQLSAVVLLMWGLSIAFVAVAPTVTSGGTQLWLRLLFPSMLSMFCPGILVAIAVHADRCGQPPWWFALIERRRRASLSLVVTLSILGALGATATSLTVYDGSRQLFAIASGVAIVLALTRGPVETGGPLLTWLGLVSYGIYLWQGVVILVLERHAWIIPMRHTGAVSYAVHTSLLFALTVPLAWVSWRLVERPLLRASRR